MQQTNATRQIVRIQQDNDHLLEELDRLYRGFAHEEGHTAPPEHFVEFVAARLEDQSMLAIVAFVDNHAAGYALVFDVAEHPFIPNWDRTGYITQLFVDDAYRRAGVGQELTDFALTWLTQRGVPDVMLNVDVDNDDGEKFWRRVGFSPYLTRMRKTF